VERYVAVDKEEVLVVGKEEGLLGSRIKESRRRRFLKKRRMMVRDEFEVYCRRIFMVSVLILGLLFWLVTKPFRKDG